VENQNRDRLGGEKIVGRLHEGLSELHGCC
jgi:hypothetical protein